MFWKYQCGVILYRSCQGNPVTTLKVQKKPSNVWHNKLKMKVKQKNENASS